MKSKIIKTRNISYFMLITFFALAMSGCSKTNLNDFAAAPENIFSESRTAPEVPALLEVPEGNILMAHVYATGVQTYMVSPTVLDPSVYEWAFVAPTATLYVYPDFHHN